SLCLYCAGRNTHTNPNGDTDAYIHTYAYRYSVTDAYTLTGQITLTARGYKVQGQQTVDLSWTGATSSNIDIYRNGAVIATVLNIPGFYTDHIGVSGKGTYTYRVCEAGTPHCSNQVTVRFGGGG